MVVVDDVVVVVTAVVVVVAVGVVVVVVAVVVVVVVASHTNTPTGKHGLPLCSSTKAAHRSSSTPSIERRCRRRRG